MPLSKDFRETVLKRAKKDTRFRRQMFAEALSAFLNNELTVAKSLLRDYINATIHFEPLAEQLNRNSKSLQRMLGPNGNPTSQALFEIIHALQIEEGIDRIAVRFQ